MKISIIVPVFNVEKYLDRCIQSLLSQGLDKQEFEVILVNDGSTDSSRSICEKYAGREGTIRIVDQDNQGVGSARNTGIRYACGDYLCFVDADDDLKKGGLKRLKAFCDNKADLIRFFPEIISPGTSAESLSLEHGRVIYTGEGFDFVLRFGLDPFCWNYLYRRVYLLDNLLFFDKVVGEDFRFISLLLLNNPKIVSTSYPLYNYRIRSDSISNNRDGLRFRCRTYDLLETLLLLKNRLDELREKNPALYDRGTSSLQERLPLLFSKMLSSNLNVEEEKDVVAQCRLAGLLPLPLTGGTTKTRLSRKAVNLLADFPGLYPYARLLFNCVFLPFIKPRLNRNI